MLMRQSVIDLFLAMSLSTTPLLYMSLALTITQPRQRYKIIKHVYKCQSRIHVV